MIIATKTKKDTTTSWLFESFEYNICIEHWKLELCIWFAFLSSYVFFVLHVHIKRKKEPFLVLF